MSTFQHEYFSRAERQIKLLEIGLVGNSARYSVTQGSIENDQYFALSYTWGDPKNRRTIEVDDRTLSITANLSRALDDFVTFFRSSEPGRPNVLIWIDQLCINQKDDEEKSVQVSVAGDIYRNAQQVLVWLPLDRDIKFGFKDWTSWRHWHHQQITSPQSSSSPPGRIAMSYTAISQPRQDYPVASEGDAVVKNQLSAWENIHSIITSPWWERAWGYVEFLLSENVAFLFGGLWTSAESFHDLISLYEQRRETHIKFCTLTLNMLKHQEGQKAPSSKFCGCFGRGDDAPPKDPNVAKDQREYLRRHSQHLSDLTPYWSRIINHFSARSELHARDEMATTPLSTLMKQARNYKVTDTRDRLYAFLNLANRRYDIKIDYSLPTRSILIDAARAVIQNEHRLDILAIACEDRSNGTNSGQIPSWVPTWSSKEDADSPYRQFLRQIQFPMARYSYGGGGPGTRASQSSSPVVFFPPNGILQARALFVDKLIVMVAEDASKHFRTFITDSGRKVATVRKAEAGDEIWIFLGADEVFTLHKDGDFHVILGHAMVRETGGETSDVLLGSMIDRLNKGQVSATDIRIK
ncbi:hypothetical protein M409DRAFT_16443 [Zasmidium cellare ATCC 36951]|uniref:Heterokaryon incompatibility domain-containing protein n=1 Tax=Zasmidium cellare ATCC 36951 TaxID=1080233 RepID=A0A6A6D431_ZASCE|nr:uncharacterized protein M409DRAFT_16443 [Zasmidium cellare ATCC 36951]KAF2174174.1 hypothetical protein M409DRAFT_16443 [Zasmidium cellare ATCC 36951]